MFVMINRCFRPQNCSSESEIQQMALQFWNGPYGGSNQLFMKNGYDHHDHQDIYTYNLSVPERFTLDVPNQSPPTSMQKAGGPQIYSGLTCTRGDRAKGPENLTFLYYICIWMFVFEEWIGRVGWVKYDKTDFPLVPVSPIIQHYELCSSNKVFSLSDIQSLPPFLCPLVMFFTPISFCWVFQIWKWAAAGHSKTLGWWMAGGIWNRCNNHCIDH